MSDDATIPICSIDFEWKSIAGGEYSYVEEYIDGRLVTTYGPMPEASMEPFILMCKQRLTEIFTRLYDGELARVKSPI